MVHLAKKQMKPECVPTPYLEPIRNSMDKGAGGMAWPKQVAGGGGEGGWRSQLSNSALENGLVSNSSG